MKPQIVNKKFKTASTKLKGSFENQKSVIQMHLLRRKLSYIEYPEELGYFIDYAKNKANNKYYNEKPHRRRKLGAIAIAGSLAVVGGGLWLRDKSHHKPAAVNPGTVIPRHFATPNTIDTNKTQPLTCAAMGALRPIIINVPKDAIINYNLLIQAVQDSFTSPTNCTLTELSTLLSAENQYTSPGFAPEPNFDASEIQMAQNGSLVVYGPQNARLIN